MGGLSAAQIENLSESELDDSLLEKEMRRENSEYIKKGKLVSTKSFLRKFEQDLGDKNI